MADSSIQLYEQEVQQQQEKDVPEKESSFLSFITRQSGVSLTVKTFTALFIWRYFALRDKIKTFAKHPWITLGTVAATVKIYSFVRPKVPMLRRRAIEVAMKIGMKALQYGMKTFLKTGNSAPGSKLVDIKAFTKSQFLPLLEHVNRAVDSHIGDLKESISNLRAQNKNMTPQLRAERIVDIFKQAIASHITKAIVFAFLYTFEQIVFHVSS